MPFISDIAYAILVKKFFIFGNQHIFRFGAWVKALG